MDPDRVVNTVGCGDALLAGFLAGVVRGDGLEKSFAYALSVATASAVSLTPGDISVDDVEAFMEQETVTKL